MNATYCRVLLLLTALPLLAKAECFLKSGDRVLFLGDSITMDGRYIAYLDLMMRTQTLKGVSLIPLGLASETVTGLSETHHPWPRPNVHERAQRALEKVKPSVVVACYGMNDGIYSPFSEERFAKYQQGIRDLVAKCRTAKAKVVLLTPPPFDGASFSGKLLPDGQKPEDYGYQAVYSDYNEKVLARYAAWLVSEQNLADLVIDLNQPLVQFLKSWRERNPSWKSGDGVHPVAGMHWLMAGTLAQALDLPKSGGGLKIEVQGQGYVIRGKLAALPIDPELPEGFAELSGLAYLRFAVSARVPGAVGARYKLMEGTTELGEATGEELAKGLDLMRFAAFSPRAATKSCLETALARHRVLGGAWRENVGHTRPQTDRNFPPLDEAVSESLAKEWLLNEGCRAREFAVSLQRLD